MKARTQFILLIWLCLSAMVATAQGTAFTYQGRLTDNGNPATGIYDLRFTIFDSAAGGGSVGPTLTHPGLAVSDGLFTVLLDFGANFSGAERWLDIAARTNGVGAFVTLTPRQKLTAAPYAVTAREVTGSVAAEQLIGTIQSARFGTGSIHSNHLALGSIHSNLLAIGAIHSNHIAPGSIHSNLLAIGSIHSNHIVPGSIHSNLLAVGAIHSNHLARASIHSNHFALGSIHSNHLALGSIHSNHIALGSIHSNLLAVGAIHSNHLSVGSIHSNALALGSVTAVALATGSIHSNHIVPGSIHSNLLAVGSIHSNHIVPGSIHSNLLAVGAIHSNHFALGSIHSNHLALGSIHSNHIAAGSIHSNLLAVGAIHSNHLSVGSIHSNALALGSVTAVALATGSIHSNHIVPGSIHSNLLAVGSIHSNHIVPGSIHSNLLAVGAIHSNHFALGSIHSNHLAVGSIHSNHIAAGSIHSNLLAAGAIHSNHLAAGSIHSNALALGSVTAVALATGSIHSNHIAVGSIHSNQLAEAAVTLNSLGTSMSGSFSTTINSPAGGFTLFGSAVAALGNDKVLVGANQDSEGADNAGAAYLLTAGGTLIRRFQKPVPANQDHFGISVAAVGQEQVLVGADADDTGALDTGAAYLFSTNGTLITTFTNPTPAISDFFGCAVAAVGSDNVLIGAHGDRSGANLGGAAYLFTTNRTLLATYNNPTPVSGDRFGVAVALVGTDKILIGADLDDAGATDSGVAYLFHVNGTLLNTFTNPTPALNDAFGCSVAAVGPGMVLIGASGDNSGGNAGGAAYLFNTAGTLLSTFFNPTPNSGDQFGVSVAAVGQDVVVIGAQSDDAGANDSGAAYLFGIDGTLLSTFNNPVPGISDSFGGAVTALGANRILVGTPRGGTTDSGVVHVFSMNAYVPGLALDPSYVTWQKSGTAVYYNGGRVGIGTTAPDEALDVRGNIRLGSSGQFFAPGGVENLRILRGRISGSGGITTGSGFTVSKTGTGAYTVTFSTSFSGEPTITATPQVALARIATCTSVFAGSAQFRTFVATTGAAIDQDFHFIAIGPR